MRGQFQADESLALKSKAVLLLFMRFSEFNGKQAINQTREI